MKQGTIIDAALISVPSSTNNKPVNGIQRCTKQRKATSGITVLRGCVYGMKVHIGVDKDSGLIHSVETTSANVHDITRAAQLLKKWSTAMLVIRELRSVRKWLVKAQHFELP